MTENSHLRLVGGLLRSLLRLVARSAGNILQTARFSYK